MFQPSVSVREDSTPYHVFRSDYLTASPPPLIDSAPVGAFQEKDQVHWLIRRWRRERRRRKVGRAYDMALEIAKSLPRFSQALRLLDVGCGNGYIAHHLSAMLNTHVIGIDLDELTEAPIDYRAFNGASFPVADQSLDVVLFCYVLHHAQNLETLLSEVRRTLRTGGRVLIYEDMPESLGDRIVCGIHNRKWRSLTGPCTFRTEAGWRRAFESAGFEIVTTRPLSRWRNFAHPVSRRFFLMRLGDDGENGPQQ